MNLPSDFPATPGADTGDVVRRELARMWNAIDEVRRGTALQGALFVATASQSSSFYLPTSRERASLDVTVNLPDGARDLRGVVWGEFTGYMIRDGIGSSAYAIFEMGRVDDQSGEQVNFGGDTEEGNNSGDSAAYNFNVTCPANERVPITIPFALNIADTYTAESLTAFFYANGDGTAALVDITATMTVALTP